MSKIQKWCIKHGYGEGIDCLVRNFKNCMEINSDDTVIKILDNTHKLSREFGISIQEILLHLMFLKESKNDNSF